MKIANILLAVLLLSGFANAGEGYEKTHKEFFTFNTAAIIFGAALTEKDALFAAKLKIAKNDEARFLVTEEYCRGIMAELDKVAATYKVYSRNFAINQKSDKDAILKLHIGAESLNQRLNEIELKFGVLFREGQRLIKRVSDTYKQDITPNVEYLNILDRRIKKSETQKIK